VIHRPTSLGTFEFVVLASLRASQLMRGCLPRVDGDHKATVIAQCEVAEGKVTRVTTIRVRIGEFTPAPVEEPSIVVEAT